MGRPIVMVAGLLVLVSSGAAAVIGQAGKSTADAVYTAEQATKGKELFDETCASCHNAEKFTGAEWTRAYVDRPLSEVNAAMAEMPMDNPGSLTAEEIGALIGYFLSMNKYPAGHTPLSGEMDALKAIMVTRPQ